MLTEDELLNPPAEVFRHFKDLDTRLRAYFDFVLLPRLERETYGTDGCMVLSGGAPKHIIAVLIDGALVHLHHPFIDGPQTRRYWESPSWKEWRTNLLRWVLGCFPPQIDMRVAALDEWLDAYAVCKDPLQHRPGCLTYWGVDKVILQPLACQFPFQPLNPVHMRLANRMLELDLRVCFESLTCTWEDAPLQFLARGYDLNRFLRKAKTSPPCDVSAALFLRSLIREGLHWKQFDIGGLEGFYTDTQGPAVSLILGSLAPRACLKDLKDLAHEALTVWLKAFESGKAILRSRIGEMTQDGRKARVLLDLVIMYRMQSRKVSVWQRRAAVFLGIRHGVGGMICNWMEGVPDPALMAQAKTIMLSLEEDSWPYDTAPVVADQKPFWYTERF